MGMIYEVGHVPFTKILEFNLGLLSLNFKGGGGSREG